MCVKKGAGAGSVHVHCLPWPPGGMIYVMEGLRGGWGRWGWRKHRFVGNWCQSLAWDVGGAAQHTQGMLLLPFLICECLVAIPCKGA